MFTPNQKYLLKKFFERLPPINDKKECRVILIIKKDSILETLIINEDSFDEFLKRLIIIKNKNYNLKKEDYAVLIDVQPKDYWKGCNLFYKRAKFFMKQNKKFIPTALLINSIRKSPANKSIFAVMGEKLNNSMVKVGDKYYGWIDKNNLKHMYDIINSHFLCFSEIPIPYMNFWGKTPQYVKGDKNE